MACSKRQTPSNVDKTTVYFVILIGTSDNTLKY